MKKVLLISVFISLLTILFVERAQAKIMCSSNSVTIPADQIIDDDVWIAGESVLISGTVNGDVYAAGGAVKVDGTINGDLLAVGGALDLTGTVSDDVRIIGGNISVNQTKIGDNLNIFGGNVTVDDETTVGGSFVLGAGQGKISSQIKRNLLAGCGNLTFNGTVGKNAELAAGQISLESNSIVSGDLNYYTNAEDEVPFVNQGTVSGKTTKVVAPSKGSFKAWHPGITWEERRIANRIWLKTISFLSCLLVGFLSWKIFPKVLISAEQKLTKETVKSGITGLLALILVWPASLLLLLTVIGIPLAVMLTTTTFFFIYYAKIAIAFWLGGIIKNRIEKSRKLKIKQERTFWFFALGLLIFFALTMIPLVNFLTSLATAFLGVGALNLSLVELAEKQKKKPAPKSL